MSQDFALLRWDASGALDPTFDGDGMQQIDFGSFSQAAWKVLLTNQFHDILPGSSVHSVHAEAEAQLAVVKNTLTRIAVRELDLEALEQFLDGPTAIAFVRGDIVAGAKALVNAARKFDVLRVKGGLAEGRVLTAEEVNELASLDTQEVMLAKVAGILSAHLRRAAFVFQALQSRFVALLRAYAEKLEEEAPAAEVPKPEAPTEEPVPETPTEEKAGEREEAEPPEGSEEGQG